MRWRFSLQLIQWIPPNLTEKWVNNPNIWRWKRTVGTGGLYNHGLIALKTREHITQHSLDWLTGKLKPVKLPYFPLPIGSMYAIYGHIYHQYTPNVSIYTIHGSLGLKNMVETHGFRCRFSQAIHHPWNPSPRPPTASASSPTTWIVTRWIHRIREIIPFYDRTVQVSEIL